MHILAYTAAVVVVHRSFQYSNFFTVTLVHLTEVPGQNICPKFSALFESH